MNSYVIDLRKGYVSHEGNYASCLQYEMNAVHLFAAGPFRIATGAKERDALLKRVRDGEVIGF